jgi:hypothetical protein
MNALVFVGVGVLIAAVVSIYFLLGRERREHAEVVRLWEAKEKHWQSQLAESERRVERLLQQLQSIFPKPGASGTPSTFPQFAEQLTRAAADAAGAAEGLFLRMNARSEWLEPIATVGLSPEQISKCKAALGDGLVGKAAFATEMIQIDRGMEGASGWTAPALLFPIPVGGRAAVVLILSRPKDGRFGPSNVRQAQLLAAQAAATITNFDLLARMETGTDQILRALAEAISARDAYTHRHSDRTRALVQALGHEENLPSQLIEYVEQGALLHDIGKIGIPDAILHKNGKLTPEEYEEMKKHPAIGYRILQSVPSLKAAASIVLYHQEWFNGDGYPEGLAAEEIPLGARLVSVIDAWDAMTSNRPYRPAMAKSAAIAELRRQAGTQFEPRIVDSFVRVVERLEREGVPVTEHPSDAFYPRGAPANA